MASKRTILTQQQRVDVLKRLDASHSCRAVAIELGCACGKTHIGRIIAQPLVSPTWRSGSSSCHPTQPHAMFLVVCMCACVRACMRVSACVCDFYTDTHLFEINYHCICTQLLIYCVNLFPCSGQTVHVVILGISLFSLLSDLVCVCISSGYTIKCTNF